MKNTDKYSVTELEQKLNAQKKSCNTTRNLIAEINKRSKK